MKNSNVGTLDWTLWFYWIIATTMGWLIGNIFFLGIPVIMAGAAISVLQWAVLHKRIHKASRWPIHSFVGWTSGYILFVLLSTGNYAIPNGTLIGAAVGVAQWLLLRKEFNWAGWWIIISTIAWTTGINVMPGMLTTGALPGALTGLTLVILFRFAKS